VSTLLFNTRLAGASAEGVGWLLVDGDRIAEVGAGAPSSAALAGAEEAVDLEGAWLVPGFVDVHCHGGGGASVYSGAFDDVVTATRTHLATGTTSMLASVAAMEFERMLAATAAIADAIEAGAVPNVVGIHLEGPFLSPARRGAQTAAALRDPDQGLLDRLLEAGRSHVRTMTIAPELPGAVELIRANSGRVRFSLGHTDASAEVFRAGVDAGARLATHLFNAMPPLLHRAPGAVGAALADERVFVELVSDGQHVEDTVLRVALTAVGPERLMLITDSSPAAGLGDGEYRFADRHIAVDGGVARIFGTDTLAGSAVTLGEVVPRLVTGVGLGPDAVAAVTAATPARAIGLTDRGKLAPGMRADAVVLDAGFRPSRVMAGGDWIGDPVEAGAATAAEPTD
jgi:N-acetylglucosamine-6-phosphate deacetylase